MPTGKSKFTIAAGIVAAAGVAISPSASTAHLPKQVEHESRNNIKGIDFLCTEPPGPEPPQIVIEIERRAPK
jgi:hypothetical protein